MIAEDFEYAGEYLKDWGYMICSIENMSVVKTSGSTLTFNNTSIMHGKLFELTASYYEDRMEITFQICKRPDCNNYQLRPISVYEQRELRRWLNRPNYHKFKLLQPDWADIFAEGSFNITNIEFGGEVYLLELEFVTNSPFAYHEPINLEFQTSSTNNQYSFYDKSDETGYIYPDIEITCLESGDLQIHNSNENRTTEIKNCSKNEVLTFSRKLICSSSVDTHRIQNDFNYIFLRVSNSYGKRKNILTFSKPVKVKLAYTPYVKVVI